MVRILLLQLSGSVALSTRGDCDFVTKAKVAQSGGAAALLVINDKEGYNFLFAGICYLYYNLYFGVQLDD